MTATLGSGPMLDRRARSFATATYSSVVTALMAGVLVSWHGSAESIWLLAAAIFVGATVVLRPPRAAASVGLFMVVTATLLRLNVARLPFNGVFFGVVAVAACLLPFVVRPLHRSDRFPFLHVFCLVQGVYLYVGFLVADPGVGDFPLFTPTRRVTGLAYYALFMVCVSVTGVVLGVRRRAVSAAADRQAEARVLTDPGKVFGRAFALFMVGFLMRIALVTGIRADAFGSLPDLVSLVRVLGFAAMVWLWLRKALKPSQKAVVLTLGALDVLIGFGTGALYQGAALVVVAFILLLVTSRRVPWLILVTGISLALLLNSAKAQFRNETRRIAGPSPSVIPDAVRFTAVVTDLPSSLRATDVQTAAERFAFADLLGYTIDVVPSQYGYWGGRSYSLLPFVVVPRVIAPWKPRYTLANEFGRRFGVIGQGDFVTSANTPIPVEAYVSFGVSGLLGVGALTGAILALAARRIRETSPDHLLVGSVLGLQFIGGIESGMTSWILVLPVALVFLPLSRWIVHGTPRGSV